MRTTFSTLFGCLALVTSGMTLADEVALPEKPAETATAPVTVPARGISKRTVEAQFGAPTERHAAIGTPPITRWDYGSFSVFFEYDHVVHAVVH